MTKQTYLVVLDGKQYVIGADRMAFRDGALVFEHGGKIIAEFVAWDAWMDLRQEQALH